MRGENWIEKRKNCNSQYKRNCKVITFSFPPEVKNSSFELLFDELYHSHCLYKILISYYYEAEGKRS